MTTGINMPFSVNASGGVSLVSRDDNDAKIIKIALADGDNDNAYQQDITLGTEHVYQLGDSRFRSRITAKLKQIFRGFQAEKRFKLLAGTIEWEDEEADSGEQVLKFRYVNLESDEAKDFQQSFKGV
jgi:hypothetical protein